MKNLKPGQRVYLNDCTEVIVVRCEWDRFGAWVTFDYADTGERCVVAERDIHETRTDAEIARLSAASPEFAEGVRQEQIASGRAGK